MQLYEFTRSYPPRILLVDDDPIVTSSVSYLLRQNKYLVFKAGNVVEAQQVLQDQIIHFAIIDVRLEKEAEGDKSGLMLLDCVPEGIATIIYTAYPDADTMLRALQANVTSHRADKFVSKTRPDAATVLVRTVRETLAEHTPVADFHLNLDRAHLAQLVIGLNDTAPDTILENGEEILRRLFYSDGHQCR